jgi:Phage terminase large subunit (GpA)
MDAMEATAGMSRVADDMLKIFEGSFPEFASAAAAKFQVSQREMLHLLRDEFRRIRAQLSAVDGAEAAKTPQTAEVDQVSQHLANPQFHVHQALANILAPPPPVDYELWATQNVSFSDRESQFTGPYNPSRFRPFTEIYKALGPADPCRIVTLSKGAQIGGTIIATVFTLGSLDLDPGDFLYVHPTEENARRWSRLKLSPLLRGSARLREIFPEKLRRPECDEQPS